MSFLMKWCSNYRNYSILWHIPWHDDARQRGWVHGIRRCARAGTSSPFLPDPNPPSLSCPLQRSLECECERIEVDECECMKIECECVRIEVYTLDHKNRQVTRGFWFAWARFFASLNQSSTPVSGNQSCWESLSSWDTLTYLCSPLPSSVTVHTINQADQHIVLQLFGIKSCEHVKKWRFLYLDFHRYRCLPILTQHASQQSSRGIFPGVFIIAF